MVSPFILFEHDTLLTILSQEFVITPLSPTLEQHIRSPGKIEPTRRIVSNSKFFHSIRA